MSEHEGLRAEPALLLKAITDMIPNRREEKQKLPPLTCKDFSGALRCGLLPSRAESKAVQVWLRRKEGRDGGRKGGRGERRWV